MPKGILYNFRGALQPSGTCMIPFWFLCPVIGSRLRRYRDHQENHCLQSVPGDESETAVGKIPANTGAGSVFYGFFKTVPENEIEKTAEKCYSNVLEDFPHFDWSLRIGRQYRAESGLNKLIRTVFIGRQFISRFHSGNASPQISGYFFRFSCHAQFLCLSLSVIIFIIQNVSRLQSEKSGKKHQTALYFPNLK